MESSFSHFPWVSLVSLFVAVIVTLHIKFLRERIKIQNEMKISRSWIEINLQNLKHNVKELNQYLPKGCEMMAVVKANAYGHGAVMISKFLNRIGVRAFAVATIEEGIALRKKGVKGEILILGYTDVSRAEQLKYYHLTQTIIDYEYALMLNRQNKNVSVHVKIDTGMHRLGIPVEDGNKIFEIFRLESLRFQGIFTHLCIADSLKEEAINYTQAQIASFYLLLQELKNKGITLPKVHIQSSYGLLNYPELHCDYARIGIALYGSHSAHGDRTILDMKLQPVLSLKSRIVLVRELAAGEGISYGRDALVEQNSRVAVLPIGYADGLPRNLSGRNASVLVKGKRIPIIGRICMDQLIIDVTGMPDIKPGDIATLIGSDGTEEIQAVAMANTAGTITNELFSRLGERIERVYV